MGEFGVEELGVRSQGLRVEVRCRCLFYLSTATR